ncbi:TIGR03747 family integrating conjugative element membrane protein [Pseudomonas synxantha]|uniref:Integrating conjugative element membrane protein (TIGR03747 family) n=1 Tax=Pseudomonas synxantha TaxID=47883 RepID=A0ACC6JW14_9PSED|nr:TIGR03747 family integrating conjugative element membrane protein [Pseudomonas synxantha]MDR6610554.1 integrating conjugative element membrane protein (TIGR03747 family) [Pseudomonas synxantha]
MSDPAATARRQQDRQQSLIMGVVTFPFRLVGVLLGSLMLSIFIECVGMYFFWPEEGLRHSQRMFEFELSQISKNFTRSVLMQEPGHTAQELVGTAYDFTLKKTGIAIWVQNTSQSARTAKSNNARDVRYYIGTLHTHLENGLVAAAYTGLVFLVRLLVLFLSLPLFIAAAFVGLIDGLVRRDIRRFGAGRESGYIYHRAKACLIPLVILPWVVYLSSPVSVHPFFILVPSSMLLAIAVNIMIGSFKKYF